MTTKGTSRAGAAALALIALSACQERVDLDMRDLGGGFSTADAALGAVDASGAAPAAGFAPVAPAPDFVTAAGAAIDRAGPVTTVPLTTTALAPATPLAPVVTSASSGNVGGTRHQVVRGETAYSIARLYGVPVRTIAEANGLGPDLGIREGQELVVPAALVASGIPVTQPGQGSPTPVPPSASDPLPEDEPVVASAAQDPAPVPQDMAAQQTPSDDAELAVPVTGSIIRAYAPGRNEGIDFGAAAGAEVRAAEAGTVAAVTTNTDGIQIVVIKHPGDLLTVYTHLENLTVAKDDSVARGEVIGRVKAGDPSFLHFEVRRGMQSQDPAEFLP